jgi:hypothetical protein
MKQTTKQKLNIIRVNDADRVSISGSRLTNLERWKRILENNLLTPEQAVKTGEVSLEAIDLDSECLCLIGVAKQEDNLPTQEDLDAWKEVFSEAAANPGWKVIVHDAFEIVSTKANIE